MRRVIMLLAAVMAVGAWADEASEIKVSNAVFEGLSYSTAVSAPVRLDQRQTFGGRMASDKVRIGSPSGAKVTERDTTVEPNGWQKIQSEGQEADLAIFNDAGVVVEGGRLKEDTVWSNDVVHLVRNWVSVPRGITLTLKPQTIVKFTENSGIVVEDGGTLDTRTTAILTQDLDDSVGGDTDCRALVNKRQNAQIHVQPGGTMLDIGLMETRYVYVDTFGTISVNVAQCLEQEERVFAQFTYTGVRPDTFSCDYSTEDITAIQGADYIAKSGAVSWSSTDEGSKWVEIPIIADTVYEPDKTFNLKITAVRGMNIATDEATIKIVDSKLRITGSDVASAAVSAAVRLDQREDTGGRLAHGEERVGSVSGATVRVWDTTTETDGWQKVTDGAEERDLLVRNDPAVVIEEGRMDASRTWSNDVVHVVRNWVTVPNGVTLTIQPGTVVKFTADTGIRVEDGGRLVANGAADARIVFTLMEDDTAAGDTDLKAGTLARNGAAIYTQTSGSIVENGYLETRNINLNTYGSVSVQDAKILEQTHCAYVPITLDTSRSGLFAVDWVAVDGTAKFGEDYTLASGTISWSGAGEGTKFIEIPISEDTLNEGSETFTVKLTAARGVNLTRESATVTVVDSELTFKGGNVAETAAEAVRFDQRTSFGGRLAHGTEKVGTEDGATVRVWDTTTETDGFVTLTDGTNEVEAVVLNDEGLVIEEGRLRASLTWSNDVVHVVRNWVTVPSGMTLKVVEGTVVKFTADTGICVEDGGKLEVVGSADKRVVFTHVEDDTVGGDLDGKPTTADWQDVTIYRMPNATFTENGHLESRRMTVNGYDGSVSVQDARAIEVVGATYVPVTVSGSRSKAFSLDWVAVDDTAKFGEDFTLASGTINWSGVGEGTKFIQIPLVLDSEYEPEETFKVKIVAVRGMNVAREEATVRLVDSELMINGRDIASAVGTATRMETRTSFGGRLAHGEETVGSPTGDTVRLWNTATETDGVKTLTDDTNEVSVISINDASIAVEEGRLAASATWAADKLHVVRNWVTVPSGITLTVEAGTHAKFTADTGIRVEDGGKLNVVGASDNRVVFTVMDDDTVDGDTDFVPGTATAQGVQVYKMPSGTITDNGWFETRKLNVTGWASVAVQSAQAAEANGMAYVPVTLGGTRNAAFRVDWEVLPGTAEFGGDYTLASGTLDWTGTGEGMKFIQVPLVSDRLPEDIESFTVRLRGACGMNVGGESAVVTIVDGTVSLPCAPTAASAAAVRLDQRTSLGGLLAHGVEKVGTGDGTSVTDWNTSKESDGWKTVSDGGATCELLVRNAASVKIEEGRLRASQTWTSDAVHLVRNWVTIPSGVTLTVSEGAVVKFTEDTGIRVEAGGRLNVIGSSDNRVVFTMAEDDRSGGDTDLRTVAAKAQNVQIYTMSGGTFSENNWLETRLMTANSYGSVSVLAAQTHEGTGVAYVPVTVNGSRTQPFSVYWRAVDGSAKCGDDFTVASGRLDWGKAADGTKFISVPLVRDERPEGLEHFTLELTGACGMNIGTSAADVGIFDTAEFSHTLGNGTGRLEQRTNLCARLVRGTVMLPFGTDWQTNGVEAASVRVTAERLDGTDATELLAYVAPTNGMFAWDTSALADGWWHLTHEELDVNDALIEAREADLDVQQNVIVHEGQMTTNEVWQGHGLTHYLANDWWVPESLRLDIESGAIVKSEMNGRIVVEDNAKLAVAGTESEPVTFTSVRDDAHGGDLDGGLYDPPAAGDWYGFKLFDASSWEMAWARILYATPGELKTVDMATLDHLEVDSAWFGTSFVNTGSETNTLSLYQPDGTATFYGTISGNVNLAKTGAGTLRFANTQTYAGDTAVNGGTLRLAAADPKRTLSPIVWRHKKYGYDRNGKVDANWKTLPLSEYQLMTEKNTMKLLWISSEVDTGEPTSWKDKYFSMAQNRLDGWLWVPDEQVGTWQIKKYHDDYLGLAIDDAWVLVNNVWTDRPTVKWNATKGWHRFTIVFGDAVGGYGALDGKCSLMISVNDAADVAFDENHFTFADESLDGTLLPDYGIGDDGTAHGADGTAYPVNVTSQLWNNAFLTHRWSFNGDWTDSVGGQEAKPEGTTKPTFTADGTAAQLTGGKNGTSWIALGADVLKCGAPATLEIWAKQNQVKQWSRVFDFGTDTSDCMLLAWTVGTEEGKECFGIHNAISDIQGNLGGFKHGTEFHIAVTFQPLSDGRTQVFYCKQDIVTGMTLAKHSFVIDAGWYLSGQSHAVCNLGHSFYEADNDASADYDEVRVWNAALSEAQLTANAIAGPDVVPDVRANLVSGQAYAVSAGATLDLNGGLLMCGELTGSGTVKGGGVLASGKVDAALTLENVELRGDTQIVGDETTVPDDDFWADHPALLAAADGDAKAAAKMQSPGKSGKGKFKANGEPMYVWEDFVAGTNPESDRQFTAKIAMDADGQPVVTWDPALNGEGVRTGVRTYTVKGSNVLSNDPKDWTECGEGKEGGFQYFKVSVRMP